MRLLFLADLHQTGFSELEDALLTVDDDEIDVICFLGDIHANILKFFKDVFPDTPMVGVAGNHDSFQTLEIGGVSNIHMLPTTINEFSFLGIEGSHRYSNKSKPLYSQEEMSDLLKDISETVDFVISHNSPYGIHDRSDDAHVGFKGLLEYIDTYRPSYVFHGHQHVNKTSTRGNTTIVGVYGGVFFDTHTKSIQPFTDLKGFSYALPINGTGTNTSSSPDTIKKTVWERISDIFHKDK